MANNYTNFSFLVPLHTDAEKAWWTKLFNDYADICDGGDIDDAATSSNETKQKLLEILDSNAPGDYYGIGVNWEIFDSSENQRHHPGINVWISDSDGGGDLDRIAQIIRLFLADNNRTDCIIFSWADWCDRPRINNFGGGTFYVSAGELGCISTHHIEESARRQFQSLGHFEDRLGMIDDPNSMKV
jgi:hypothetical protein